VRPKARFHEPGVSGQWWVVLPVEQSRSRVSKPADRKVYPIGTISTRPRRGLLNQRSGFEAGRYIYWYTHGMPTTIKVSTELRDRLKLQAAEHGRTIGAHLAALADDADRAGRFARLRQQVAATPAALRTSYAEETAAWNVTAGDGLPAEDFSDWPGYVTS
jgi:hypothetical protein